MNIDGTRIAVAGAGLGGLASAIRLAAAGCDVTVLEMASSAGGKMRTLPSAGGPVDAGPTVMTLRPVFDALFAAAGAQLDDWVTLHRETVLARHWWADGSSLDLHADPEASAEAIGTLSGAADARAFRAFNAEAARLFEAFEAPIMQNPAPALGALVGEVLKRPGIIPAMGPLSTLASRLAGRFRDPRLQQLFGRYATYVGGSPYASPAVLALIWHAEARGVWRVEGGMHLLAAALQALAESIGVRFRFNTRVSGLEVREGRVCAATVDTGERIATDALVFNGDPRALSLGLVGDAARSAVPQHGTEPRSLSAYVWSFAAEPSGRALHHHNVFFADDPRNEFGALKAGRRPEDATLYLCAEDRGSGLSPDGIERFEIIMNGPPVDARTGTPSNEEEFAACQSYTFQRLESMGLRFSEIPGRVALTMPSDFNRLFPGSAGSLYGRSPHGLLAAFHRPKARTALKGLYLAGGGAHPGAGIPMATLSGQHAAEAILQDRTSTSMSRRTATRGGTSTGSRTTASALSRSSPS